MKNLYIFIAVLFIPWSFTLAKYDEFEDGDDIMEYDDNDFAEFEDVSEDTVTESPQRIITTEDDEEEATVELEGQDENQEDFDDADTQVRPCLLSQCVSAHFFLFLILLAELWIFMLFVISSFRKVTPRVSHMMMRSLKGMKRSQMHLTAKIKTP